MTQMTQSAKISNSLFYKSFYQNSHAYHFASLFML